MTARFSPSALAQLAADGSAGDVLTLTGSKGLASASPAAASASAIVLSGALGSRPAAGTAGRLYLPTDSWYTFRDNGSAWDAFRNGRQMFPLDDSGWTGWVNQGTAARDATTGTLRLTKTFASGDTQSLRYKSAPSTPWTITCCFRYGAKVSGASQYLQISLGGRQSSDGKLKMVCAFHGNNAWTAQASKWDSATAYNSDIAVITPMSAAIETDVWVRMTDNGTDVLFDVSADGYDWLNVSTDGRTNFCTIDQVFIAIQAATASYTGKTFAATVLSYKET